MRISPISLTLLLACGGAFGQTAASPHKTAATTTAVAPAPASSIPTLQTITVTGVVPGPGLWKVSHGDHVLWILGLVQKLPAGIKWQSGQVAQAIAGSQVVLESPSVKLKVHSNWFGKLYLALQVVHAVHLPHGQTLADVLSPSLYARWQAQKQRYFGDDNDVERYRPVVAASMLLDKAMKANGLRGNGTVDKTIAKLAKEFGVHVVKPNTNLQLRHPHKAVKAFESQGRDTAGCLKQALDIVANRIPVMRARANAWATGDIAMLRKLPPPPSADACLLAMTSGIKSINTDNLDMRMQDNWLNAAEAALASNRQSFAILSMHDLLDAQGYLAALQARGYMVTAPDADIEAPAPATSAAPASNAAVPASATSIRVNLGTSIKNPQ